MITADQWKNCFPWRCTACIPVILALYLANFKVTELKLVWNAIAKYVVMCEHIKINPQSCILCWVGLFLEHSTDYIQWPGQKYFNWVFKNFSIFLYKSNSLVSLNYLVTHIYTDEVIVSQLMLCIWLDFFPCILSVLVRKKYCLNYCNDFLKHAVSWIVKLCLLFFFKFLLKLCLSDSWWTLVL